MRVPNARKLLSGGGGIYFFGAIADPLLPKMQKECGHAYYSRKFKVLSLHVVLENLEGVCYFQLSRDSGKRRSVSGPKTKGGQFGHKNDPP